MHQSPHVVFLLWQHILMRPASTQKYIYKKGIGRLLGKSEKKTGVTDWKYDAGWRRFSELRDVLHILKSSA